MRTGEQAIYYGSPKLSRFCFPHNEETLVSFLLFYRLLALGMGRCFAAHSGRKAASGASGAASVSRSSRCQEIGSPRRSSPDTSACYFFIRSLRTGFAHNVLAFFACSASSSSVRTVSGSKDYVLFTLHPVVRLPLIDTRSCRSQRWLRPPPTHRLIPLRRRSASGCSPDKGRDDGNKSV